MVLITVHIGKTAEHAKGFIVTTAAKHAKEGSCRTAIVHEMQWIVAPALTDAVKCAKTCFVNDPDATTRVAAAGAPACSKCVYSPATGNQAWPRCPHEIYCAACAIIETQEHHRTCPSCGNFALRAMHINVSAVPNDGVQCMY